MGERVRLPAAADNIFLQHCIQVAQADAEHLNPHDCWNANNLERPPQRGATLDGTSLPLEEDT